jgi:ApaG protein
MDIISAISEGIKISVETFYQQQISKPVESEFVFAYLITIENHFPFSIKLKLKNSKISYGDGSYYQIHNEPVPKIWPRIEAGREFRCLCLCKLHTDIGRMQGSYVIEGEDCELREADIPAFDLVAPSKCN